MKGLMATLSNPIIIAVSAWSLYQLINALSQAVGLKTRFWKV
jgi:hypothetical protein